MDSPLTIGAFVVGVTQIVKDLGVQGHWLKLVCVLAGAAAAFLTNYQPALWDGLGQVIVALTATGLVSFGKDVAQTMSQSSDRR